MKWDPRGPILLCIFLLQSKLHPQGWTAGCEAASLLPDFSEIPGGKLSTLIFLLLMQAPLLSFLVRPRKIVVLPFTARGLLFFKDSESFILLGSILAELLMQGQPQVSQSKPLEKLWRRICSGGWWEEGEMLSLLQDQRMMFSYSRPLLFFQNCREEAAGSGIVELE